MAACDEKNFVSRHFSCESVCVRLSLPVEEHKEKRRPFMALGTTFVLLLLIGLTAGIASGMFGIGGGVIVVPALVLIMGFSLPSAVGTSLAILLPPVGLAAVIEYFRHGNVDLKSAIVVALGLFTGAWISAYFANRLPGSWLRVAFGVFIICLGIYMIYGALTDTSI